MSYTIEWKDQGVPPSRRPFFLGNLPLAMGFRPCRARRLHALTPLHHHSGLQALPQKYLGDRSLLSIRSHSNQQSHSTAFAIVVGCFPGSLSRELKGKSSDLNVEAINFLARSFCVLFQISILSRHTRQRSQCLSS